MIKIIKYTITLLFIAGLFSCSDGNKSTPTPLPVKSKAETKVKTKVKVTPVLAQEEEKRPEYVVSGVRDPFQPYEVSIPEGLNRDNDSAVPLDPMQRLMLSQIELVGIIVGEENRAVVQESSGMGYLLSEGTLIGENSGIVTKISLTGVTIKQHFKDYMGHINTREVVLSLRKEEGEF